MTFDYIQAEITNVKFSVITPDNISTIRTVNFYDSIVPISTMGLVSSSPIHSQIRIHNGVLNFNGL